MAENIEVRSQWESMDVKSLSQWIASQAENQRSFYKANEGRWDDDRFAIFEQRNKELEAAIAKQQKLQAAEEMYKRTVEFKKAMDEPVNRPPFQTSTDNGNGQQHPQQQMIKSVGEMFTESHAYKSVGDHETGLRVPYSISIPNVDFRNAVKTVMTTSAGYAPPNDRTSIVVPYAQREPRLADLIPSDPTVNGSIKYMEETTALAGTNAQVSITENSAKFENTLAFTERTAAVETIGTWLPVTTQQLDDVPGIQGIINNRLLSFLQLKEEDLLLTGTGVPPQIEGFLTKAINTQARGADSNIDCIFKGLQQVRTVGYAEPDAIVMHPTNFSPVALYKDTAGNYAFNVLSDQAGVTRLFGKTLILTPAITLNTALVGSFRLFSHISRRMGMTIQVGLNDDDFTKNKRTVLGEFRESLEVYRLAAFTACTGLQ
jgi:HK97 family phage major capsid protein